MQIAALESTTSFAATRPELSGRNAPGFAESLAATLKQGGDDEEAGRKEAREAAQQLVASAFLMPLLSQARQSPFKTEMFHGGRAEKAFGQQLDTLLADRMSSRMDLPVVDAVERMFFKQSGGAAEPRGGRVNVHV